MFIFGVCVLLLQDLFLAVKSFCCRVDTHEIRLSEMCVFITSVPLTTHNCVHRDRCEIDFLLLGTC